MSTKIGIFGGTFDPPHLGHLILAAEAYYQLGLARLLWVLTPTPPHKPGIPISPLEDRLILVQAAIASDPSFELSRVDIERQPPHYALDTVLLLKDQYPTSELIYLMGGDSLHDLPTWHRPGEFVAACDTLGVMRRPGYPIDLTSLENVLPGITAKTCFVETPLVDISSSDIRCRVAAGEPFRYFVPKEVWELIEARNLYR